jgi:integral membrane protein
MPLKYFWHNPSWEAIGPVHGGLFLIFVFYSLMVGTGKKWKLMDMAWILLVGSFVPFGTFYIDHKFFKELQD